MLLDEQPHRPLPPTTYRAISGSPSVAPSCQRRNSGRVGLVPRLPIYRPGRAVREPIVDGSDLGIDIGRRAVGPQAQRMSTPGTF